MLITFLHMLRQVIFAIILEACLTLPFIFVDRYIACHQSTRCAGQAVSLISWPPSFYPSCTLECPLFFVITPYPLSLLTPLN